MTSSSSHSSDADLLELLRRWYDGDREALGALLLSVEPWLRVDVRKNLHEHPDPALDVSDVVQQSLLNFLQWGPRFQPENAAQLRALMRRIASNHVIDEARRHARRPSHSDTLSDASRVMSSYGSDHRNVARPERSAQRNEEREWVRLGLQFLDSEERFLIVASEVDGLPWKDIAATLNMESPDAARMRATRLKLRLANILRQLKHGRTPTGPESGQQ